MGSRNPIKSLLPRTMVRWIIPFWTIVLIAGSLSPGTTKNAIGSTRIGEPGAPTHTSMRSEFKHQMFHWLAFGLTAYLFLCLTDTVKGEIGAAAGAAGLGIAIELVQIRMYHSGIEWDDIANDVLAAAAVYAIVVALGRFTRTAGDRYGPSGRFCSRNPLGLWGRSARSKMNPRSGPSTLETRPREQERHARPTAPDTVSPRLDS